MAPVVDLSVELPAPPDVVFAALTDPDRLRRWFAIGGAIRFEPFEGGSVDFEDPPFGRVTGSVEELDPPRHLAIHCHALWPRDLAFSLVSVGASRTRLRVVHGGFEALGSDPRTVDGFRRGWSDRLEDLRRLLETETV